MHPYWIQKIEEHRRSSVMTFWMVVLLIVVLPLLLMMKADGWAVVSILCFGLAGLRLYLSGREQPPAAPKDPMPASDGAEPQPQWQNSNNPNSFPGPQSVPTTPFNEVPASLSPGGVPTTPFASQFQQGVHYPNAISHNELAAALAAPAEGQDEANEEPAPLVHPKQVSHFHDVAR